MRTTVAAAYLLTMFCLLQRHGDEDANESAHSGSYKNVAPRNMDEPALIIHRAKQYIEANLRESLTLETIACAAYVSRSHLAQIFRKELGQTAWDYVSGRRLHQAKIVLAETDILIEDVARLSGLSRTAHFFIRFAQLTGMSPGEFRKVQSEARKGMKQRKLKHTDDN